MQHKYIDKLNQAKRLLKPICEEALSAESAGKLMLPHEQNIPLDRVTVIVWDNFLLIWDNILLLFCMGRNLHLKLLIGHNVTIQ